MWFIGVEVQQETSAPPPKKNPGSVPDSWKISIFPNPWVWLKVPNIFPDYFSVKETLALTFDDVVFSKGGLISTIKISFLYSWENCVSPKGLNHDSGQKFSVNMFQAYFSE